MRNQLYIDGRWVTGSGPMWNVINPATEEVITTIRLADAGDVDRAVTAADKALSHWKKIATAERANLLHSIAQRVHAHRDILIHLQMANSGKPYAEAEIDINAVVETFTYYADGLLSEPGAATINVYPGTCGRIVNTPVGVAGLIVPWNFPMVTTAWKLAPALAAGCTVVIKPSEFTPLAELALAGIIEEVGLPPGVVNVLPGLGAEVGAAMVKDMRVRKISFTGSGLVGKQILRESAEAVKNVSLELGGKSAIIVFADADLHAAAELVMAGIFYNAGQMCSATSRLLVESSIKNELTTLIISKMAEIVVGSPMNDESSMGPLTTALQYQRVIRMVDAAKRSEGATLLAGGKRPTRIGARGFFYEPTLIEVTDPSLEIWTEEVFGPVLSLMQFTDDAHAVELANSSKYGLAASVVSGSESRAERVASELEAGFVTINSPQIVSPKLSWGGYKESSLGRELGRFGLASFQEVKSIIKPSAQTTR